MTNRKSHTRFRLVPKSTTLDDLEWQLRTVFQNTCVFRSSKGHAQSPSSGGVLSRIGEAQTTCTFLFFAVCRPKFTRLRKRTRERSVVCNAVFRLSVSCSVPEIFAMEVRSRPKSRRKSTFFGPQFFWGRTPQFWT